MVMEMTPITPSVAAALRADDPHCPRCSSHLHPRKPDSVARTWALVIAAAVLYVPANTPHRTHVTPGKQLNVMVIKVE